MLPSYLTPNRVFMLVIVGRFGMIWWAVGGILKMGLDRTKLFRYYSN